MKTGKLENMVKGWFIGNFNPSIYKTNKVEVAIKKYKTGDYEDSHYHKIAKEITVIITGKVEMNKEKYKEGDIIIIEPYETVDFYAVTDVITAVVKIPGVNNDKYQEKTKGN